MKVYAFAALKPRHVSQISGLIEAEWMLLVVRHVTQACLARMRGRCGMKMQSLSVEDLLWLAALLFGLLLTGVII
jgi:hypothetical protein